MPGGGGGGPVGRGGALINPAESSLQGTTCPKRLALSVPLLAILSLSACGCRAARGAGRVCLSQGLCTLQRRTGSARAKDYRTQRCGNRCNSDIYIYIYIYETSPPVSIPLLHLCPLPPDFRLGFRRPAASLWPVELAMLLLGASCSTRSEAPCRRLQVLGENLTHRLPTLPAPGRRAVKAPSPTAGG